MYALIWVAFAQIILVFFPPLMAFSPTLEIHSLVGIVVVVLAWYVFVLVRKTKCPDRIKRITKTTAYLGVIQVVLGLLLALAPLSPYDEVILFLHAVNAVAIISQASSSATAFDMWEEGRLLPTAPSPSP
jgi:heme A synthase